MLFECFPCARKKVLEQLFKVCYIINIETEERKTKTMKTLNTLTTTELKTTKELFAKYQASQNKVSHTAGFYNCTKQQMAATTRSFNKLYSYLTSIATEKETSNIIFNLTNP